MPDQPRNVAFAPTDQPLRDEVSRLGDLIGQMLAEQGGASLLARVEAIRLEAIARRERTGHDTDGLVGLTAGLDPQQADAITRGFSMLLQCVNLAERIHRIRRRRDYERQGAAPQPGSLLATLQALHEAGVTLGELMTLLPELKLEPVFTAHPTEAVRRALLEKEQLIASVLIGDLDRTATPRERAEADERIRWALTSAWQTAEQSALRPSVADEVQHVCFYLGQVLYRVLPVVHEEFARALEQVYGAAPEIPALLCFGSWVGGDMDGNPNVGAATIRETLDTHRTLVLYLYQNEATELARRLSQSVSRVGVGEAVLARLQHYRELLPEAAAELRPRHLEMPYRCLLLLMVERLKAARAHRAPAAYTSAAELIADLDLIADSLRAHHGEHAGLFVLQRFRRRIAAFGFHLAALDVRQDSRVHRHALEQLCARPFAEIDLAALCREAPLYDRAALDDSTRRVLDVYVTLAAMRRSHGAAALGLCIVSMTRSAEDVLAVLALARAAGLTEAGQVPLDVAPLFETVDDLRAAPTILDALCRDPLYRLHLEARGAQHLMLGYSDSSKDGGLMASRFAVQRAQVELLEVAERHGVRVRFFHGRGGSVSRGGGKTERAVIAAPRGSIRGQLRLTEQGEVIHRSYGLRAIALRNLEQMGGAVLRATLKPRPPEPREAIWREAVAQMAEASATSYRALVHESPSFVDYFRQATPIDVIERMTLGSRPPKRTQGKPGIDSLRAIPWVFAWSQTRLNLSGWYGVGSGLAEGIARVGLERLQEMAEEWAFFGMLLDDVEMVLAKSDLDIARRYSELASPELHQHFFAQFEAEFQRCCELIARVKRSTALLDADPRLRRSIRLRNPYVDPISLIQVDLLRRWREAGRPEGALFAALVGTVNGVSAGVQNTG
ncbi:MAG: phosphoenolpyruvate carboxylase [Xanthomonadales bacterium]|jgi:phosphoenolpyruvate carboxylase|nr:phosphoenolpyruvate carboxylase [Xanthomonadales bacterium]